MYTVTIVIPVFNEANNINKLVNSVNIALKDSKNWNILFVDDGSTDETLQILESVSDFNSNIKFIKITHSGFAEALKTGFKTANSDIIVTMDGDNTHDPKDIPKLLEGIEGADLVIGSRYVSGGGMENVPQWRRIISVVANTLFKFFARVHVKDVTGGFRCIRKDVLKKIQLESNGFEIQVEMTIKAIKEGFNVVEVPIRLSSREVGESKFSLKNEFLGYFIVLYKSMWW